MSVSDGSHFSSSAGSGGWGCYMSDFVRPCCWFCIQKCSPPSRTKTLSGFLPAMLAPLGGHVRLSCGYVGTVGTIFGHLGAHDDAMWAQFGGYNSGIAKNHPKLYLQNALPHGPRGVTEETPKSHLKNKTSSKTRIPMAGKTKRNRKSSKNTSPKS